MKIRETVQTTETIERNCCVAGKDLKPYRGTVGPATGEGLWFCVHCGQVWRRIGPGAGRGGGISWTFLRHDA